MDWLMAGQSLSAFWVAMAITLFSGFVKGAVGFAMPLIMISAFSAFLPPELALAGLILPTLVTNISQAFRQGWHAALGTLQLYWRMIAATVVFIVISAQFVGVIPKAAFLFGLGLPVTLFAGAQLLGRNLALRLEHRARSEWILGAVGGLYGGVSGVWGPPVLIYLLSIGADKRESLRMQGGDLSDRCRGAAGSTSAKRGSEHPDPAVFCRSGAACRAGHGAGPMGAGQAGSGALPPLDTGVAGADRAEPDAAGAGAVTQKARQRRAFS